MKRFYQLRIVFQNTENESDKVKEIFEAEHFKSLTIERKDDCALYRAVLNTDKEYSSQKLNEIMRENKFILSVERCDEE